MNEYRWTRRIYPVGIKMGVLRAIPGWAAILLSILVFR